MRRGLVQSLLRIPDLLNPQGKTSMSEEWMGYGVGSIWGEEKEKRRKRQLGFICKIRKKLDKISLFI